MKKIAIMGSLSFLARNFIKYVLDNNLDYDLRLYDYVEMSDQSGLKYTKIDFSDVSEVMKIDFSVDIIMIFIGKTGTVVGFDQYKSFIEINEIMLLNILNCYSNKKSSARIIYPSSRLIYRNSDEKISEESVIDCKSIYAMTKYSAENYLRMYKEVFGINYVILRICTPIGTLLKDFGHYGTFEIFKNQAIEKSEITIFGDGLQKKTFTDMSDICKAFALLSDRDNIRYSDYNLGGQELSLLEIAQSIAKEYNVPVKHIPWPEIYLKVDGGSVVFDSSRFDSEFNISYNNVL